MGKATISTRNTGREIPIGEGVIPQIERYCSKHVASKITINTFHTVINEMVQKADDAQGNHLTISINTNIDKVLYIVRCIEKNSNCWKTLISFYTFKVTKVETNKSLIYGVNLSIFIKHNQQQVLNIILFND